MPAGRPTKYNQEVLDKAKDYLENYDESKEVIPSVVGLALVLDIRRETLHEWARDENKKEFSNILEKINAKQQQVLIAKGLKGEFNSNITKLVLGKHGFHDKQQQEISGPDGKPQEHKYTVEIVNAESPDTK